MYIPKSLPKAAPCPHLSPQAPRSKRRAPSARWTAREFHAKFDGFAFRFDPATNRQLRTVKLRDVTDAETGEAVTLYMRVDCTRAWDLLCSRVGAPIGFYARFRRVVKPSGRGGRLGFEIAATEKPFPIFDGKLFTAFLQSCSKGRTSTGRARA